MLDQILASPLHTGVEAPVLLLVLVFLEVVLSADNAIALATISQGLEDRQLQRQALNLGLIVAYVLRISLILTAAWVIQFWQVQVLGASYLLWLALQHFASYRDGQEQHGWRFNSLASAIPVIALTDLAFSLDSVTTAIAVSQKTWLVLTGATIGIIALRFMAGLFIRWLDEFIHLEDAGYFVVTLVGLRLLIRAINRDSLPPEWVMMSAIALILLWGFQERTPTKSSAAPENTEALASELLTQTQEQPTQIWSESLVEQSVSYLLRAGLVIASSTVLVGGVLYLIRHGLEPAEYQVFRGEPFLFRSPNGVVTAVSLGSSRGIIQLGLLLLIATPVARVAFSLLAFLLQRDLTYVIVTLFVLAGLTFSLIGIVR
ncbi:MAG: DUF1634 domain-containing protein [Chroococcidiopsidaceae cyanobacterium CP_BM_ER_R8_30]|nr:DUF1634 domain-containing protein [Chroococcidiopsidaceae cyanobacterium CP_BM_ER_R8_30]